MNDYCDYDPPAFYSWSEPVARKQYRCCECSAPIDKGQKHFACVGKWEGDVMQFRQHLLCCQACMHIRDELNDGCITFGELFEWLENVSSCNRRTDPKWQPLRKMLADIKRRERRHAS